MKRFHVHIVVKDLAASIDFYSRLFGAAPAKLQGDYAKWMLDEPRVNFAISSRGHAVGVNHFGMQVDTPEELASLKQLAHSASGDAMRDQGEAGCCYARSEKHWTMDPQGLAWEHFLTLSDAPVYGEDSVNTSEPCCVPLHSSAAVDAAASCSVSQPRADGRGQCCG